MALETLPVDENFRIEVVEEPELPLPLEVTQEVDSIWESERARLGEVLFDGRLLSALSLEGDTLVGCFIPYRYFVAQLREPSLFASLQVNAVAVTGLTTTDEPDSNILLGKRADTVSQYPDMYEVVPSGGIDPDSVVGGIIDYREQLLRELEEEASLAASIVTMVAPHSLTYDTSSHIWELALNVTVDTAAVDIAKPHPKELQQLLWLPVSEISDFLNTHPDVIVPFTKHLLERLKDAG